MSEVFLVTGGWVVELRPGYSGYRLKTGRFDIVLLFKHTKFMLIIILPETRRIFCLVCPFVQ